MFFPNVYLYNYRCAKLVTACKMEIYSDYHDYLDLFMTIAYQI